jgi:flagellar basal-body rod modification protein FlgD
MAITSTGLDASIYAEPVTSTAVEDKTSLSTDDFMTLLLVELQHQDPTEPTDSATILTQTSQLASLEATDKTNVALENLATSLAASSDFASIAAIGKTADLGSNGIILDVGEESSFEVYFPSDIQEGSVEVLDANGNIVQTLDVGTNPSGVYQFDWDGSGLDGNQQEAGIYYITASYTDPEGNDLTTRMGAYPIESIRFEDGQTLVKVGSSYVPLENVVEIY